MIKKHKSLKVYILLTFCLSLSLALPSFADGASTSNTNSSVSICDRDEIPEDVKAASGCNGGANSQLVSTVQNILYSIIAVCGIVAVVYVILGGINYMTSAGDPNKAQKARLTILYAVIGLVICALAFVIVNFTISKLYQTPETTALALFIKQLYN